MQNETGLLGVKPAAVSLPLRTSFATDEGELLLDPNKYRRLVSKLLYLNFTRSDLSYAVNDLSQFVHAPTKIHWEGALHILKYHKGTICHGLCYSTSSSSQLQAYCDSDYAKCNDTRKSITGFYIFLGDNLISWKSKNQHTISPSTAEAEYHAMATTVYELKWLFYLLSNLHIPISLPIPLWCDNKAALHITSNPVFHERTKHIKVDCHVVRAHFKSGFITQAHIPGIAQPANIFTPWSSIFPSLAIQVALDSPSPTWKGFVELSPIY